MASIIDNKNKFLIESLKSSLKRAESIDILTAFFYFSGFDALANELKDKKIRILVGKSIDPETINQLCSLVNENQNESLEPFVKRGYSQLSNLQKKKLYIDSFIDLFNKSTLAKEFDNTESQKVFKMFFDKLNDGTLEIRLTNDSHHGKFYILTNKPNYENLNFENEKGIVFMGSSNFTYNGLLGQGEMNEGLTNNDKYDEYKKIFEELWNDSKAIDIKIKNGNNDFVAELEKRLWPFATPSPYNIFIRILFELYDSIDNSKIKTPNEISKDYLNFKYQIDAIKIGLDCINKNNGVIIADVVGLGKSIVASAIAYNLDIQKTVIISPPHLIEQWNGYQQDFGLRGVKVESCGKIEELHSVYANDPNPILYIIDEAHRYRNELTDTYQYLHQLTRSNAKNKVILLTATPYNNKPQDLFALVKLFQTPSHSTINTVENLGLRFRELIAEYNKLDKKSKPKLTEPLKLEFEKLSRELRRLIEPVIVRRSRIDLNDITEYADDLKLQGIEFSKIIGPELIEYDLGDIRNLYTDTLVKLSTKFNCARYNPSYYLIDHKAFMVKYGEFFEETDIQLFQANLAKLIKRLLVMRFESSKAAFKITLDNILLSYENMKKWWEKGYVPIKKRGYLPDPDEAEIEETLSEINDMDTELIDIDKIKKKAIPIPKNLFKDSFINAVENDVKLLSTIKKEWFKDNELGFDPKFEAVKVKIDNLLKENKKRKIVVFSYFADTAKYVKALLEKDGYRVFLYTGSAKTSDRDVIRENFDASHKGKKKDDYDIIIATDALSEGFNLNRAGVIFNYDIPYNPTRVVQRIGRINRINKKIYDNIFIFNFFPTDIGEENTLIKGISTLKMLLINNIVGNDTKTLTPDETLQSYFKTQYDEANTDEKEKSWDIEFRNTFNSIKHNTTLKNEVMKIPERARIVRKNNKNCVAISFAKRGDNSLFAIANPNDNIAEISGSEVVLNYFKAECGEKGYKFDDELDKKFIALRDEISKPCPKIKLDKRKGEAIDNLEKLLAIDPSEKDYLNDLLDVIKTYDDLSDGELKYLAGMIIKKSSIEELKQRIPEHYIIQIREKAENVDAQTEVIMFTEDLRNDNN